ncbi:MAG TPA: GNAT family N-acetyltransferase [Sphingomonas sp.]
MADAGELFTDVPLEKDAHDQTVLGWKGSDGLYAIAAILRDYPRVGIWYLGFLIVDSARRGRGVGRSIYATVEDWAAARGATEIRLAVLEANEPGERLWRSLGFCEVRRVGPDTFKNRSHHRIELNRHLEGGFVEGDNQ